jgi:hypothetical protein
LDSHFTEFLIACKPKNRQLNQFIKKTQSRTHLN